MKWILCDERLPEEGQMVLTTIRGHDVIIPQEGETLEEAMERIWNDVCYVSMGFIGSDGWYGADGFPEVVHPIAWMPLPKPYTADRKTESNSEKPNNCEDLQDWKDRMWAEAIVTEPQTDCDHKCVQTEVGCESADCPYIEYPCDVCDLNTDCPWK